MLSILFRREARPDANQAPRCISQLLRRIEVNTQSICRVNNYEYVLPVWPVPCCIRGRQATRGGIEVAANCRLLSAQELLGPDEFHASEDQSPRGGSIASTAKSIMSNRRCHATPRGSRCYDSWAAQLHFSPNSTCKILRSNSTPNAVFSAFRSPPFSSTMPARRRASGTFST
jgi:hypothetical protein